MRQICPVCGKKVGGLTGVPGPTAEHRQTGLEAGAYREGMCASCLTRTLQSRQDGSRERMRGSVRLALDLVFTTPSPVPANCEDRGLVTGYCIMGTGPFADLFSSVTDIFGTKSNSYLKKARSAEREALDMMKIEALKLGCDAVHCVRVSLTEATSGNGMLMVSVQGCAVRTPAPRGEILDALPGVREEYGD
ncbi:MAG: heavy metal-binding domain-containing protein [Desulfovibrionaceae bacterium]|nr:heavy metal-binding domain-containing protein [Desulfovibrionaceae bacterium]